MALKASTLRPGLLVSLKTSVKGNVNYRKRDIETAHPTEDGGNRAKWETERTISDINEYKAATKVRNTSSDLIRSACAVTAFGYLCPDNAVEKLNQLIGEARQAAEAFNATSRITKVYLYIMVGRVAPDDAEAVRAINSEVRDLLSTMEEGIKNLDVASIRKAATMAKNLGSMLSEDAQKRVEEAVKAARDVANKINKAGEQAAMEVDRITVARITEARMMFLDLDDVTEVAMSAAGESRALDLEPTDDGVVAVEADIAAADITFAEFEAAAEATAEAHAKRLAERTVPQIELE